MEKIVLDTAIKFGAGRYRQEQGLLEQCGEEVKRFGKKAYIVAGADADLHCLFVICHDTWNPRGCQYGAGDAVRIHRLHIHLIKDLLRDG